MPLLCVGVSHHTAPLAVREQVAVARGRTIEMLATSRLRDAARELGLREVVLLSTCNRTELYGAAGNPGSRFTAFPTEAQGLLAQACAVSPSVIAPHLFTAVGHGAVRHLCLVAAGLDSQVPGEAEVLGQVAEAHRTASHAGVSGPILGAAFRSAVRAGRRVRSETGIGRLPSSVASEGVRALLERLPQKARSILVVGTGQMARAAAQVLAAKRVRQLRVVGRSDGPLHQLCRNVGAEPVPWHHLQRAVAEADGVITATAAPHPVIPLSLMASVLDLRGRSAPLILVDIAVPRDVEPGVASLGNVELLDLDQLKPRLADNVAARRRDVPAAEAIVSEEVTHFESWRRGAALKPVLAGLHSRAEMVRRQEVERALRRIGPVDEQVRQQVVALSRSLVGKLLDSPSRRLRLADPAEAGRWADAIEQLFDLE
ncbi:MAG TPA: glutamyl-tRNA reductase [Gemmatimonadales bacterium]|nr:glutamyl-tRNA reductase [Gemmatimonadales bacterium]